MRGLGTELRHAVNHVDDEMKTIQVVHHRRLAGRNLFNAETQRKQSATPSNAALQPPLSALLSLSREPMVKADTQKDKGDISIFGRGNNRTSWPLESFSAN